MDKVIVGADRIVQDAVVNKIGTYSVAVLAHEHGIPFYVAAPKSTFDLAAQSSDVIIEERKPEEVTHICFHANCSRRRQRYEPSLRHHPAKIRVSDHLRNPSLLSVKTFGQFKKMGELNAKPECSVVNLFIWFVS